MVFGFSGFHKVDADVYHWHERMKMKFAKSVGISLLVLIGILFVYSSMSWVYYGRVSKGEVQHFNEIPSVGNMLNAFKNATAIRYRVVHRYRGDVVRFGTVLREGAIDDALRLYPGLTLFPGTGRTLLEYAPIEEFDPGMPVERTLVQIWQGKNDELFVYQPNERKFWGLVRISRGHD